MFGRSVPAVAPEAVAGVSFGEGAHRVVADDLGHNARSSDRRAPGIGPGQALYVRTEIQVTVCESTPGARPQGGECPGQGFTVRQADAVTVDPPGRVSHYGDGLGPAEQCDEDFLPQSGPQQLGVVNPGDLSITEDDGSGHQRPCQRATAGLIGPG